MSASVASQTTRRKLHKKVFERINQNDKHLVNLCELNNFETQVILLNSYSELARTLFPFVSTNDLTKIK